MRNFFCKCVKKLSLVYMCGVIVLFYRVVYNEYYPVLYEETEVSNENREMVYPLGTIVGIYTECEGVFVIETCEIETIDGQFKNPVRDKLYTGDYIQKVNGIEIKEKEDLVDALNNCDGKPLELIVVRDDKTLTIKATPVKGKNGKYMLGAWVKDDLAGVGTITYFTENGQFAALGHGMNDGVTDKLLQAKGGDIYFSDIIGIQKGEKGEPGEVKGVIYYGASNHIGELDTNCTEGIYGKLDEDDLKRYIKNEKAYEVAEKQEIKTGAAQIITDISGEKMYFDIEITYVDYLAFNSHKGLHIEVTDPDLIELTGGIVQGMSGSPIIQNGKIVGAVTHVLINDPEKGYGIFIDEMMK